MDEIKTNTYDKEKQSGGVPGSEALRYSVAQADIDLLRANGVSEDDIAHCLKVAEKALEIAYRTSQVLDFEFVGRGALFHDLGKGKTHAIEHGKIGAEMGRALGLPEPINAVMEKH
ncbi:MAG: HDIG domain-containing protein, partial [Desulfobacterales bacterium]|nr:HDIG domain-containing protein [Desulfobacterales bacterium]